MNDVLLEIGTKVVAVSEEENLQHYLIIGKRAYNPNSGRCWDYISVPLPNGFDMNNKAQQPYENTNLYFFNHTDICEVIK